MSTRQQYAALKRDYEDLHNRYRDTALYVWGLELKLSLRMDQVRSLEDQLIKAQRQLTAADHIAALEALGADRGKTLGLDVLFLPPEIANVRTV